MKKFKVFLYIGIIASLFSMNPAIATFVDGETGKTVVGKLVRILPTDQVELLEQRTYNTGPMTWEDIDNNWDRAGYCCWYTSCVVTLVGTFGVTVGMVIWFVLQS